MSRIEEQKIVTAFSEAMMQKLDKRSDKGRLGWRDKSIAHLLFWLDDEVQELKDEIALGTKEAKWEAVDVALLSLMMWDKINNKGTDE